MCGIAGLIHKGRFSKACATAIMQNMLSAMLRRGPDSQGVFFSRDNHVVLGHIRLAIIDNSTAGHQPMVSDDKRFVLSYNGELFDYQELRTSLNRQFRGHSDTEVLLEYLSRHTDLAARIAQLDGMFAFALFNQENNELILVRDQLGIKPLYYYQEEDFFLFASEPWALFASGLVAPELSSYSFPLLASLKMEAELEDTWYQGIKQLMPATLLRFQVPTGKVTLEEYWQPDVQESLFAEEMLSLAFTQAVTNRIPAEVHRGAFLSGGVDSTAIIAELVNQGVSLDPCVIRYKHEAVSSDFSYANLFAKKSGLKLNEIEVDPNRPALVHEVVQAVQRPIIHGGEMGMLMAYQQMSQLGIKVCYSGHGADEFWGYQDSDYFPLLSLNFSADMHSEYYLKGYYFGAHHQPWLEFLNEYIFPLFSRKQTDIEALIWDKVFAEYKRAPFIDPYKKARYHMMKRFLVYVNNMVDRTSMYYSVEDRPVFQNLAMVNMAFQLPEFVKNRQGISSCKPFLKKALAHLLPNEILNRPKVGFQPPKHDCFRDVCLQILAENQPFNLSIAQQQLQKFPLNQLLFLTSSQLIINQLNEFKKNFYKRSLL